MDPDGAGAAPYKAIDEEEDNKEETPSIDNDDPEALTNEEESDAEDWSDIDPEEEDANDDGNDDETWEFVTLFAGSSSLSEVVGKLSTLAEQEREATTEPLKGNIYRLFYINRLSFSGCKSTNMTIAGLFSVVSIQLISPLAIFVWAVCQIDWANSTVQFLEYRYGSHAHGISHVTKVILAFLFLLCFTLNGLQVIKTEHEMFIKLQMLIHYADPNKEKIKQIKSNLSNSWGLLGRFVNATLPIGCALVLFLLFVIASSPKDVVFDSLGLIFLYKLDDIDGDLGLLSPKEWNEERMGRFYFKMVNPEIKTERRPRCANEAHRVKKWRKKFGCPLYMNAARVMHALVILLPVAFLFTDGLKVRSDS